MSHHPKLCDLKALTRPVSLASLMMIVVCLAACAARRPLAPPIPSAAFLPSPTSTPAPKTPHVAVAAGPSGHFTITGDNWPANDSIYLGVLPPAGKPVFWLTTLQSDANGAFQADFEWKPAQPSGAGSLVLAGNGRIEVTTPFDLTPPDWTPAAPTVALGTVATTTVAEPTATLLAAATSTPPLAQPSDTPLPDLSPTPLPTVSLPPSPTSSPTPPPPSATLPPASATPLPASATPLPASATPSAGGLPVCFAAGNGLSLRSGPGNDYGVLLNVQRSESLDPIARNADGTWIEVVTFDNVQGWAGAAFMVCQNVDLARLPVVSIPPTPPPLSPTSTPTAMSGWQGEYFNNTSLTGNPSLVRNDAAIKFNWGGGSPAPGLASDQFSVRWTRRWRPAAGTYRFYVQADDNVRLYMDNRVLLDTTGRSVGLTWQVDINVLAGDHALQVEYTEFSGGAMANVWWEQTHSIAGWEGQYFANRDLSGAPAMVRTDTDINFNWVTGAPDAALPSDDFSVRWSRQVELEAGTYEFNVRVDDGMRLWVDGRLVMDQYQGQVADVPHTADVYLSAGWHTLRVDYFEETGLATIILGWERIKR